jgi:hypothetical protein
MEFLQSAHRHYYLIAGPNMPRRSVECVTFMTISMTFASGEARQFVNTSTNLDVVPGEELVHLLSRLH